MRYRNIGSTDVAVSEISLGCWTLGGLNWVNGTPNGWADVDEAECTRAIRMAMDRGVNHFDNADVYGNGRAERMLARTLGGDSGKVIIASKVGHFPGTAANAYEAGHIRSQCEQSLRNLKRDVIDIYYFHHGNFGPDDAYLDEAIDVFARLKAEGKIRVIGLSAYSHEDFARLVPKIKPDVLQSWASAADDGFLRAGSPCRKLLDERKMSFVAFGPLKQGILLGKYSAKNPPSFAEGDHRKNSGSFAVTELDRMASKVELLKSRFGARAENLARAALQYLLSYDVVACVIPGFRNLSQVEVNLNMQEPLTSEDVEFIRDVFGA